MGAVSRGVRGGSAIRKRVTVGNGRRGVTSRQNGYRYVTRATATTKCRVGQECSSTQGLYRLCGHPHHRNPLGNGRRRHHLPLYGRIRVYDGGPLTARRTACARSTVHHAHAPAHRYPIAQL